MHTTAQSYSSGEWLVRAASDEEFIQRWTTFSESTLSNAPGAVSFVLFGVMKIQGDSSL